MKICFEWISLILSGLGIVFLLYSLFKEFKKPKTKRKTNDIVFYIMLMLLMIEVVRDKLYLFN